MLVLLSETFRHGGRTPKTPPLTTTVPDANDADEIRFHFVGWEENSVNLNVYVFEPLEPRKFFCPADSVSTNTTSLCISIFKL